MKKVRLADIAAKAGVGTATVERVLNDRGGVTHKTAEKVILAAKQLGYQRLLPELHRGVIRVEVVMVRPDTPFFLRLNRAFQRIAASLDSAIVVHRTFVDELDAAGFARHIMNPDIRRSGLIVVALDHPDVRRGLEQAREAGIDVVHIVSPTGSEKDIFVGIDNYAAGRTAAFYMSRMLGPARGKLLALCHSWVYQVHKERLRGFSDYLAEKHSQEHLFSQILFGQDDELRSAEILRETLAREPDVIGLYNAGGANEGIATVLRQEKAGGKQPIVWIGHELTDQTRGYLKSGLMTITLDQAPEIQARRSLDTILKRLGVIDVEVSDEPVPFLTYTAENI